MKNLKDESVLAMTDAASGSAGTEVDSTAVDCAGYDGVAFILSLVTSNAGNYVKVQGSNDNFSSDTNDLLGSKYVPAGNSEALMMSVERSSYRYHRLVIIRAGTNSIVTAIFALLYRGKLAPLSTTKGKQLVSPIAGTA